MLRTQLRAELAEIGLALQQRAKKDSITQECQNWHQHFVIELGRSSEETRMLELYTKLMQEILKDEMPYFNSPLEEDSYLANDGKVYGYQALCCYLQATLLDLENPFFVEETPHLVVKVCVQWLKRRNKALPPHPDIQSRFAALEKIPPLPTEKVFKRRAQILRLQRQEEKKKELIATAKEKAHDRVNKVFGPLFPVGEVRPSSSLFEREREAFSQRVQVLDQRICQLEDELQKEGKLLTQAKRETLQLEVEISKTERILAERRAKEENGGWFAAVASVVVTAIVTAVLQGTGIYAAPVPGGVKMGKLI